MPRNLSNLKPFKKGQSGNPLGRSLENPEMKKLKNLTEAEMVEVGSLVVKGTIKQLRAIKDDPNASALKCMMAAVAIKTISTGNPQALDILLNRLVGKAKERVEVVSTNAHAIAAAQVQETEVIEILNRVRASVLGT